MDYEEIKQALLYVFITFNACIIIVIAVIYLAIGWEHEVLRRALVEMAVINIIGGPLYYFISWKSKHEKYFNRNYCYDRCCY